MKNKMKISFDNKSADFILEATGNKIDSNGFVVNANTKEYVLDADNNKFKAKNLIGILNKKYITKESQIILIG